MGPIMTDVAVFTMAAASDKLTTEWAFRNCSSCREGNPLAQSESKRYALKVVGIASATIITNKLRKSGHSRAAKIFRYSVVAIWLAASANNIVVGNK
jgi:hypothetical protein